MRRSEGMALCGWTLIAALALLAGCRADPLGPAASGLRDAQARWRASGISDYAMQVTVSCFCSPAVTSPVAVQVRGGRFQQIFYAASGAPADTALFRNYLTVERLFGVIEDALARGAYRLEADYAPDRGYPSRVSIDYSAQIADEELGFQVSGLVILEPAAGSGTTVRVPARF